MFGFSKLEFLAFVVVLAVTSLSSRGAAQDLDPADHVGPSTPPGRSCGDVRCLQSDARCADQHVSQCECTHGWGGDGELSCHSSQEEVCSITGRSVYENFNGDVCLSVFNPCRYMAAILETMSREINSLECKIRVYAHGERVVGDFFIRGFDVTIQSEIGSRSEYSGFRARGVVVAGHYTYALSARSGPSQRWGSWQDPGDGDVLFEADDVDQRVILEVHSCGLRVYFRVEDLNAQQTAKSGLVVSVDKHEANIRWLPNKDGICLNKGRSITSVAEDLNLSWDNSTLQYLAFTNSQKPRHDSSPDDQCDMVSRTLARCTHDVRGDRALRWCDFILGRPEHVVCIERPGGSASDTVLGQYVKCVESVCTWNATMCYEALDITENKGCRAVAGPGIIDCKRLILL